MYSEEEKEKRRSILREHYNQATDDEVKGSYNLTTDELKIMDELGEVGQDILDDAILVFQNMREKWGGYPTYQFADELIQSFQIMYPMYWTKVLTAVLGSAVGRAAGLNDNFNEIVKDINSDGTKAS